MLTKTPKFKYRYLSTWYTFLVTIVKGFSFPVRSIRRVFYLHYSSKIVPVARHWHSIDLLFFWIMTPQYSATKTDYYWINISRQGLMLRPSQRLCYNCVLVTNVMSVSLWTKNPAVTGPFALQWTEQDRGYNKVGTVPEPANNPCGRNCGITWDT